MAHFAGAHTASGGRDYATTGAVTADSVPPAQQAFVDLLALQSEGKVRHVGVSNFGVQQLEEALATGVRLAVNQVSARSRAGARVGLSLIHISEPTRRS
eukprot:3363667-Prymnesium_polylepis.1